jgi:hypothetical protein
MSFDTDTRTAGPPVDRIPPQKRNGYAVWTDRAGSVEVRFVGRGPSGGRRELPELLRAIGEVGVAAGWLKQVHSAAILPATAGWCGEGDAMVSDQRRLALAIVTADCVPVLLGSASGEGPVAAVHAGWRGLAAGIVPRAVDALMAAGARAGTAARAAGLVAWIGPAIGRCCYEVEDEVLEQVAAATEGAHGLATPGPRGRPYLDVQAAAERQLRAAGVGEVRTVSACTRCDQEQLFSYRREGPGGGRNVALVWAR